MSYRVKDFWKNIVAEFDTFDEMDTYVSSSRYTSSVFTNEESASLNYFQYDFDLHETFESSSNVDEAAKHLLRITYLPGEDDDIEIIPAPTGSEDTGSIE